MPFGFTYNKSVVRCKLRSVICQHITYINFDRIICSIELSEFAPRSENTIDETLVNNNYLLGPQLIHARDIVV